ncbi:MerR family DNA-binding transcriptional regulator [Mycolicibacterium komossense]|uniref:MerR family DNA-binding transcriptional regulator n=1 Tax=Mycolicibacterium komossense TaxID=1779 RepID=A0ABT3CMN2_9MYCO|nr:MerR family DNA-binding transcriptional regulator [Mycolicibacterium komossense]
MQTKHASSGGDRLSVGEAASLLGVSADTLRRWEKAGRITSLRTPVGHRRYNRADVEALLTAEQPA